MFVALDTSHEPMAPLNVEHAELQPATCGFPQNTFKKAVTRLTSHVPMGPYVASAVAASAQ